MTETKMLEADEVDIDLYDKLRLGRDLSTEEIRGELHNLRLGWGAKAQRAGSTGDQAREMLALIDRADRVFVSDSTRGQYDASLLREEGVGAAPSREVNWLERAWNYYFLEDEGAAGVAARKAREQDSESAMAFVVSAWVSLMQQDLSEAKRAADEAFVLDELDDDTADVHHVRGVVFYLNRDYERALKSFDRALANASALEAPEILWRKALVWEAMKRYKPMYDECLQGLTVQVGLVARMQQKLVTTLCRAMEFEFHDCSPDEELRALAARSMQIDASGVAPELKKPIQMYMNAASQRAMRIKELKELAAKTPPFSASTAVKIAGAVVVTLVLAQIWAVLYLVLVGLVVWLVWGLYKQSEYKGVEPRIQRLREDIKELNTEIATRIRMPDERTVLATDVKDEGKR